MKSTRRSLLRGLASAAMVSGIGLDKVASAFSEVSSRNGIQGDDPSRCLRMEICLNGMWESVVTDVAASVPESGWAAERVPSKPPSAHRPPHAACWYRTNIDIPMNWKRSNRAFYLRMEKVGHYAAVYCNGDLVTEHYGQYTPVEAFLTSRLDWGKTNEIAVYVHDASGRYARPGADLEDRSQGNAYRGATSHEAVRNWTGIAGDVSFGWRPAVCIDDVYIIPSVRRWTLATEVDVRGIVAASYGLKLRLAVLDAEEVVHELPERSVTEDGVVSTTVSWENPVLWGPEPYGEPKLYVLQTELWKDDQLLDRVFVRFGFREVWIEGRELVLNGKRLWLSGTYFNKLASNRYLNDAHSQSLLLGIMQASGLNLLHGHWDSLGQPWLDRCDEMGMLVMSGFFCDGRPDLQSVADSGWEEWMAATCREWAITERNHPSIILWRPADVIPQNLGDVPGTMEAFYQRLAQEVRRVDRTRPLADGSDVFGWAQSPLKDMSVPGDYDDGSSMAAAVAANTKPLLTKEIYTPFSDFAGLTAFLRTFYEKAHRSGGAGVIVQHIPLLEPDNNYRLVWLSDSGTGNRDREKNVDREDLPNWCDSDRPVCTFTAYARFFAELYVKYMQRPVWVFSGARPGEVLVSGLRAGEIVFFLPTQPASRKAFGIKVAADGTAWAIAVTPGRYRLQSSGGTSKLEVLPQNLPTTPGYDWVPRIDANALYRERSASAGVKR